MNNQNQNAKAKNNNFDQFKYEKHMAIHGLFIYYITHETVLNILEKYSKPLGGFMVEKACFEFKGL